MLWFILLTALINLAFGFALAVYVRNLLDQVPELLIVDNVQEFLPENTTRELSQSTMNEEPAEELDIIPMGDVVPPEMLEFLEAEGLEAGSLVEASAQVLRLEVGIYRDNLVKIETKIRSLKSLDIEVLEDISVELDDLNRGWLDKQSEAADHLDGSESDLGSYSDIAESLSNVLMDQAAQIESTLSNLEHLDFNSNAKDATRRMLLEVYRLLGLAHDLRDKMQETLLTVLRSERRFDDLDRSMQLDSLTGCLNRTGIEVTFFEWWRDDLRRERLISTAILDIDAFKKTNE
jgi:diguanylate cyclase